MPAFYNQATLTYGGSVIESNRVQGELAAALAIDKTTAHNRYRPGDMVALAVHLTNRSATDAENLHLSEDLGAYAFGERALRPLAYVPGSVKYYVNGEAQPAPAAEAGEELAFRGIRVPANGDADILYAARVNDFAPAGACASIVSTSRLESGEPQGGTTIPQGGATIPQGGAPVPQPGALPLTASAELFAETVARLRIRKSLSPASVAPGEPLTYTLTIENSGATPVRPDEGAAVTDRFDPVMDIAAVRYNGAAWSAPADYSYDANTGMFITAAGRLSVPAASFAQDISTGKWRIEPGVSTIEITGTLR